jgi:hypothetical protein
MCPHWTRTQGIARDRRAVRPDSGVRHSSVVSEFLNDRVESGRRRKTFNFHEAVVDRQSVGAKDDLHRILHGRLLLGTQPKDPSNDSGQFVYDKARPREAAIVREGRQWIEWQPLRVDVVDVEASRVGEERSE